MAVKPVDNETLLREMRSLEKRINQRMDEKFDEIKPYITFLRDVNSARKVSAWIIGGLVAILSLYIAVKQSVRGY